MSRINKGDRSLPWSLIHRLVVFSGPAIPAAYFGVLSFLSSAAQTDSNAKVATHEQVIMLAAVISTPRALGWVVLVALVWAGAVWLTEWLANGQQRKKNSVISLGRRADECAQGVVRLAAMHRQRDAVAQHHAWKTREDHDFFSNSATLLGDYALLYQAQAVAIFREAVERCLPLGGHPSLAEHPTNPLGVEEVGRELGVLAERIKNFD